MQEPAGEPTDEELRAALEEQMRDIRVEDVILQTVATLVNLAARSLGLTAAPGEDPAAERDIEQARLGIEGVRALLPLTPEEQVEPIRQALSQLQMAFAQLAQVPGGEAGVDVSPPPPGSPPAGQPPPSGGPGTPPPPGQPPPEADDPEAAERAKARSKIWTPPGA